MTVSNSTQQVAYEGMGPITQIHHHKHTNKPVIQTLSQPPKSDPPGAQLYKQAWVATKLATSLSLLDAMPISYTAGFILGALEGGRKWCEFGPPKKLNSEAEMKDFGATAHASTFTSLVSVLVINTLGITIPMSIDRFFPQSDTSGFVPSRIKQFPKDIQERITSDSKKLLPQTNAEWFKRIFALSHGISDGEETVNCLASWIDIKERKS